MLSSSRALCGTSGHPYFEYMTLKWNSDNIDPKGERSDAELNDLLGVVRNSASPGSSLQEKFQLDAKVTSDGDNFSVGERQLRESVICS
jgi:hypothetical protein